MFVYVIVCSESLKIYIGQHKGSNLQHYLQQKQYEAAKRLSARSHLYAAMRNYPRETWSIHSLVSGIESRQELDALEKHFIRVLKTQHPDVGYNICDGGEGFTGVFSDESKKKMSESHKIEWAARSPEKREAARRGSIKSGLRAKTMKTGIFAQTASQWQNHSRENGRKAAITNMRNKTSIFGLTRDQRLANSRLGGIKSGETRQKTGYQMPLARRQQISESLKRYWLQKHQGAN